MSPDELEEHRLRFMGFFNSIPLEHRAEAEQMYQAFRSRILYDLYGPGGWYGGQFRPPVERTHSV